MHNLTTVLRFEVLRTLKKKSFWLMALLFPFIAAGFVALSYFSNKATSDAADKISKQTFSFMVFDDSKAVDGAVLEQSSAVVVSSKQEGVSAVQSGRVDAFFYYPKSITDEKVEIFAKSVGLFDNDRYKATAKSLLSVSVLQKTDSQTIAVARDTVQYETTLFKNGEQYDALKQIIAPGMFLVLFYLLIVMFGNQMLNSTVEEKENRVVEMILVTIEAHTLIIGKIISLFVLGMIQVSVILVPFIAAYIFMKNSLALPSINIASIPLDASKLVLGLLVFMVSFLLFTSILVAVGAACPTAKEAGSFFGVIVMLVFAPLYSVSLFLSSPNSPVVKVLSYFPLTAPIPLLSRNAFGTISLIELSIGVVSMLITSLLVIKFAVRIFRYGSLQYSRRLTLKEIFSK